MTQLSHREMVVATGALQLLQRGGLCLSVHPPGCLLLLPVYPSMGSVSPPRWGGVGLPLWSERGVGWLLAQ